MGPRGPAHDQRTRRGFLSSAAVAGVSPVVRPGFRTAATADEAEWPMVGGSSGLTNANLSSPPIEAVPTAKWTYTATRFVSAPITADGTVYFTADDQHLYAVDEATGQERWHTYFPAGLGGMPAYSDGALFVCDGADTVYRVRPDTGDVVWELALDSTSTVYGAGDSPPSPVVAGDLVYVSTKSELYAINAETGSPRWIRRPGTAGESLLSYPAVSAGRVVVGEWIGAISFNTEDRGIYAFDADSGEPLWVNSPRTTDGGIGRIENPPALTPDAAYVTTEDHNVHRIDAATGEITWTHALGEVGYGPPSALTVTESTAYLYITRSVLALDLETGEPRWQNSVDVGMSGLRPPAADGQVYTWVGDHLWALDADSGRQQWRYPGLQGSIAVADGTLYVADDNSITAIEANVPRGEQGRQTGTLANERLVSISAVLSILLGIGYAIWRNPRLGDE